MMNLARNAAQHTDDQATIGVGSSAADGWVRLWVRDTGPGVMSADHERIFRRFARADGRAHHGRIDFDSEPGKGATFTVVLPAGRVE